MTVDKMTVVKWQNKMTVKWQKQNYSWKNDELNNTCHFDSWENDRSKMADDKMTVEKMTGVK